MVAVIGTERWGCRWVSSSIILSSFVRQACQVPVLRPGWSKSGDKRSCPQHSIASFKPKLSVEGRGPWTLNWDKLDTQDVNIGLFTMAGSTAVNGFHSSSFVQRDGRISPGSLGAEVTGLSGLSYARCGRLKFREGSVNRESVSTGFSCLRDDGNHKCKPRSRAVESMETSSQDSSWEDTRPKKQSAGTKGSTQERKKENGIPAPRYVQAVSQNVGEDTLMTGALAKSEELIRPRQVNTSANSAASSNLNQHSETEAKNDVKLTLQRVLEARARLASKLQSDQNGASFPSSLESVHEDHTIKDTINMAREVLAGYKQNSSENGRVLNESIEDKGDGVQVWGASLARSGLPKPLNGNGSIWRRDLGTFHNLHGLTDQPDIVRKVVGALSGVRSSTGVMNTMNDYMGQVAVSDLHQVLHVLGSMKEWLTALQVFEWMQTMPDYKPDELVYRTMINLLANARRMNAAEAVFDEFAKSGMGLSDDDYVVLMSGYTRCGSLQRGVAILQKMKDAGVRPFVSAYNVLLDGCTKSVRGVEIAAQLSEQMRQDNVAPDRTTYVCMINMYSRKGLYKETIEMFEKMHRNGFVPDKAICHTVLTVYSKLGDVKNMMDTHRLMLEQGIQQDSVTFNILLNTLNRVSRVRDVERYWALMRKGRITPDLTTCSILINTFGRAREWDKIDLVLAEMGNYGLKADIAIYNSLISVYGKAGLFYEVELVVKSLKSEISRLEEFGNRSLSFDLVTYNTLLDVYGKAGRLNDVIHWFAEMKKAGVQPDVLTFNSLVTAYGKASHFDGVKEVLELFRNHDYKSDLVFYNTLLFMFGRGGHYDDAWKVFEDMKQTGYAPTLETYNSLILVFGRGSTQQCLRVFADMINSNVEPNMVTFRLLMDIHAKKGLVDDCLKIFNESQKYLDCKYEESILSAAFRACCNMRCIEKAEDLVTVAEAEGVDIFIACYNWLILGYGKKGLWQRAENVIERMNAKGVKPNAQSFSFLLEAYSLGRQIPKGEKLITRMLEENLICGTAGHNSLLRFYMRAGDIESIMQTYESLQTRGPKPNQSSYVPMIEALTKEGRVDERFWGIAQDLENAPFDAHYTIHGALLSALARCGQSQDADRLLEILKRLGCSTDVCDLLKEGDVTQNRLAGVGIWKRLTTLFSSMEREGVNLEAERNFHNAVIDALWSLEYKMRALKVTELSVTFGVFGTGVCQWKDDCWTLDVRFAGTAAAQILLLTWLSGIRQAIKSGQKCLVKFVLG